MAALVESEARLRQLNRKLEKRVSERTEALEQQTDKLQARAAQLTTAEQRERKRLAALLHDDLQQQLVVAARMQHSYCTGRVDDPVSGEALAKATSFLEETLSAPRDLTREVRPPVLYESGLVEPLRQLAIDIRDRYGLHVAVRSSSKTPVPSDDLKALLFVCSRELLINSAKHAGAAKAVVELAQFGGHVRIVVEDEGRGFEPEVVNRVAQASAGGWPVQHPRAHRCARWPCRFCVNSGGRHARCARSTRDSLYQPLPLTPMRTRQEGSARRSYGPRNVRGC